MLELFNRPSGKIRLALLVLAALQIAGCSSREDRAQGYYERGMKLLAEHDNARASVELRNAVKLNKDLLGAWRGLAQIDEADRNWGGVAANLRSVVELDPHDVESRLKLGKLLLISGSLDEALKLVNATDEADSRHAGIHALKAAILFKLSDSGGANREAQTALELEPGNPDATMILAGDRLSRGDAKGALSLLDSEPMAHPKNSDTDLAVQLIKIKIYEQMGDLKNVELVFRNLVDRYPQNEGFRNLLTKFYIGQHRLDDAEKGMRAAAVAHPTDVNAGLDLVRFLYMAKKDPAAARQEIVARINAGGEIFLYQIALADMDFVEGNFTDGTKLIESIIGSDQSPEHVLTAQTTLAQMYMSRKNLDSAETLVSDILRKDNRNTAGLKLRASIRMERGQLEPAISDLRQALNDQPRSTDLMLLLAVAYERTGSIELAEKQFADATRASNFDPGVGLNYVAFLQRRGSIGRAEDVLVELNGNRPNNIQILSALAQVRLTRQNWIGAQEIAESIRRIENGETIGDELLGAALSGRSKYDESISVLQKAYDADPKAVQPMASLVRVLVSAKKTDQAVAFLKSVLESNPTNADALVLLGSIQLANNAPDQGLKNFKDAIDKQPKNIIGYRALASLYAGQKNYDEALRVVRVGLKEQPDSFVLHLTLAGLLEQIKNYEGAISEYEFMLDKQSGNLIVANNLASLLADYRTDKASLDKAQSLAVSLRKSQVPQFKDTLGWVSYRRGDYKNAVSLSEEAAAVLPNLAPVRYHLGMSYIATGQLPKAAEQLQKGLDLEPNGEFADQIREALKKTGSK